MQSHPQTDLNLEDFEAVIIRLSRDLRQAAETLSEDEAAYLVADYYNIQKTRIAVEAQRRTLDAAGKPSLVTGWLAIQAKIVEDQIRAALDRFSSHHKFGEWPRSVIGIGPVIAAGLIAHTHMEHLTTAGHLWSFAGLNPLQVWDRKTKRPWNADLKVLCWKIGQSFMKFQNHPNDVYGRVYATKKAFYITKNNEGGFVDNAQKAINSGKKWNRDKVAFQAYHTGKLPPGHIDAMARRYAVKLFLSHYWEVCYTIEHNSAPPLPYPIVQLGHVHIIPPTYKNLTSQYPSAHQ